MNAFVSAFNPPPPPPPPPNPDKMAAILAADIFNCNLLSALVQVMAWRQPGNKPILNQWWARSLTHTCGTRGWWANRHYINIWHVDHVFRVIKYHRCSFDVAQNALIMNNNIYQLSCRIYIWYISKFSIFLELLDWHCHNDMSAQS